VTPAVAAPGETNPVTPLL